MGVGAIIGILVVNIIMGIVSKSINEGKGYEGGFAWGFWLGILGIIVVACRSTTWEMPRTYTATPVQTAQTVQDKKHDPWFCTNCGKKHEIYEFYCDCGQRKLDTNSSKNVAERKMEDAEAKEFQKEEHVIRALKEYKELMDAGIISAEEFEAKKKTLLG